MKKKYTDFKVDGKPILAPDQDFQISKQDLDAEGSGRDELGFMHRIVLRHRVTTWSFSYLILTKEEYNYINSLFNGKPEFDLEILENGVVEKTKGYCASIKYGVHNAISGIYKNVSFNIIEC